MIDVFAEIIREGKPVIRRKVGSYNPENHTFSKPVLRSKHYMRKVQGYGMDLPVFKDLLVKGVERLVIMETDTGDRLETTPQDWQEHGKVADMGHGRQIFLSEKYHYKHSSTFTDYSSTVSGLGRTPNAPINQKQPVSRVEVP